MNIDPDLLDDDLSSAMGTETLLTHGLVPDGLPVSSKGSAEQQIRQTGGTRYLVDVDQLQGHLGTRLRTPSPTQEGEGERRI
jgi:hypothetical protein